MSTERELANARRDYERQIREVSPGWWKALWVAARDLWRAFSAHMASAPRVRRKRLDRKEAVERAAKERI